MDGPLCANVFRLVIKCEIYFCDGIFYCRFVHIKYWGSQAMPSAKCSGPKFENQCYHKKFKSEAR